MRLLLFLLFIGLAGCFPFSSKTRSDNNISYFSYNIPLSPQTFDPLLQRGTNARYLLNHLYITLYKWDKNNNLKPNAAKKCEWENTNLICTLKKGLRFQDGTPVKAIHFIKSLNLLAENPNRETIDFTKISYELIDDFSFKFISPHRSQSLMDKLTLIEISPRKEEIFYKTAESVISSTKFRIHEYVKNQFLILKHTTLEDLFVKIYFIEDQSTALRLYETQKLSLLTQLPVREITQYKNSLDLFQVHMIRMDGIFFNQKINKNLKKALIHSVNFNELKRLYQSIGTPGCPPIPKTFYIHDYCYKFDLAKAKSYLKKVPKNEIPLSLKLSFSSFGGLDDIQKGMEWFAHQWKTNLNLNISIEPLESGLFLDRSRWGKFDIIRKGIPLDTPTCLDALSSFKSGSPNNIAKLKTPQFDQIISEMDHSVETQTIVNHTNVKDTTKATSDPMDKPLPKQTTPYQMVQLCDKALELLYKDYTYLPLGPMYFSFLENRKFKGWYINALNILDLEDLNFALP